jgi:hypothetical protein
MAVSCFGQSTARSTLRSSSTTAADVVYAIHENDILQSNRNQHIAHPSGEAFSWFDTGSSRAVSTSVSVALYAAVVGQKLSHNTRHIYCLAQLSQWEQRVTYMCGERSPQALA